jgi:hypothetical protein
MANPGLAKRKSKEHEKQTAGSAKTGTPVDRKKKEEGGSQVGGIVLALLLFVVIGSAVIQIINNARNALMYGEQVCHILTFNNTKNRHKWNKWLYYINYTSIHRHSHLCAGYSHSQLLIAYQDSVLI